MMCTVMLSVVNGRDESEHIDTPRHVQHKSISQTPASLAHEVRSSTATHASSSSRPVSGVEERSPAIPLSAPTYVETPRDSVMAQVQSVQPDKEFTEQSVTHISPKPSTDTADTSIRSHDIVSRVSVSSHHFNLQSSVKTARTQESSRSSTTSQPGNHGKPKTPGLALHNIYSL